MTSHNIVGCEAVFERGHEARERAFSPAHGSILILPTRRKAGALLAFVLGVAATLAAAAFFATQR